MQPDRQIQIKSQNEKVILCGISDPGLIRKENQDTIFIDKDGHYLLLADGMGGLSKGRTASQTAVRIVKDFLDPAVLKAEIGEITLGSSIPPEIICLHSLIDKAIEKANSALYEKCKNQNHELKMGTTIVGLVVVDIGYMVWFHVGDSRAYLWRDQKLKQLTTDHSVYEQWVASGKRGDEPKKNVITRAIGPRSSVAPDIGYHFGQKGDKYFLCSDGLTDGLDAQNMIEILKNDDDLEEIIKKMIDQSNRASGKDNLSIIACQI